MTKLQESVKTSTDKTTAPSTSRKRGKSRSGETSTPRSNASTASTVEILRQISEKHSQIHIFVNNSFSAIRYASPEILAEVKEKLTYDRVEVLQEIAALKKSVHFLYGQKKHSILWRIKQLEQKEVKKCWLSGVHFPTGHLHLVCEFLEQEKQEFKIVDRRKMPKKGKLFDLQPPFEPRYYQKGMLEEAKKHKRGVFVSCVGSGKTLVAAMVIAEFQVPTLFISPSKSLAKQTARDFQGFFKDLNLEVIESSKNLQASSCTIVNIQMLSSLQKKGLLPEFLKNFKMICVDEVHHAGSDSYTNLLPHMEHIFFRFGFSGTFLRNDSRTMDLHSFSSQVLYKYTAKQAVAEGFLTPLKIKAWSIPGMNGYNYQAEYKNNYSKNEHFLTKVGDLVAVEIPKDKQILILIQQKDAVGSVLATHLEHLGIDATYITGDTDKDEVDQVLADFNAKKIRVLIGSSIIGEGIDVKSTDHLIMCQGGKSVINTTQATGRVVRLFPGKSEAWVHDFCFEDTKYLQKHLKERLKVYKEEFAGEVS